MADRSEIDEVRTRTDIVATIEQYVTLKRAGRSLKACCPFHNEKTPSFQVTPDLGMWKCFGCGEGGDVIKFVQKIENLSFFEALERLAANAGVTLTQRGRDNRPVAASRAETGELSDRDRIYRVNGLALRFFRDRLALSEVAQRYVAERRIESSTQQEFNLGYAPDSWDGLTSYLAKQGVPPAEAELAGLVARSERGSYYDRLRGRLVFPIYDVQERPIAFGGRILGPSTDGQPKYWNSPEHPAFSKSKTLYGLNRARKAIAEQGTAIVVEGYTDVISAHQAGFKNVVAPLGTALTDDHVKILARLAPSVRLCFDADSAGLKAAFRAGEIFSASEVDVRVLELPDGEDPDSLLRAGRSAEFAAAVEAAAPLIEYRIKRLIRREPAGTDQGRIELMRNSMPILASVKSVIEREQYIKMVAPYHPAYRYGAASIVETQIRQDVEAYLAGHGSAGSRSGNRSTNGAAQGLVAKSAPGATDRAERNMIRALLSKDQSLATRVLSAIRPDEFLTERGRAIAARFFPILQADIGIEPAALIGTIDDEGLARELTDVLMAEDEPLSIGLIDGEAAYMKRKSVEVERTRLKQLIDRGEAGSDHVARYAQLAVQLKGSERAVQPGAAS